ncbi:MAG: bifunctional glutamate N-acetyltransferase/amino-acid acetyltransferase ArgJ [Corynebacteriales bacterium]|nr:bifunctional glutamate N-acetyltransferase/amino-acid acetyltransferase ArgJ [Mycobacteriales bacterium]
MTITSPQGFQASGIACGLKSSGAPDLALVRNEGPQFTAAGVFTANRVQAAPVQYTKKILVNGALKAIVLNSGGANACTGVPGYQDTIDTAEQVANALSIDADQVAVCSTGLIGERLPMPALLAGVQMASTQLRADGGHDAAEAILTTDSKAKTVNHAAENYTIGAMAKGAGMLAPSLATMLVVITTDAAIAAADADKALRQAVLHTFDRLDSDGCMSTNDTVLLLANGASGHTPALSDFTEQLTAVCADLSAQLMSDAEGSTKDVIITVTQAATEAEAVEVARAIARNNLLKCALFGNDPNWGRVLAAIGTTTATFDPDQLDVAINGSWVCEGGAAAADRSTVDLGGREINITARLNAGPAQATVFTNDLSHAYVHENSAYSS